MDNQNDTTHETGEQMAETKAMQEIEQSNEQQAKTVPYARFQEVNNQKKQAEQALNDVVTTLISELPENLRQLVPSLPPAQQITWINQAKTAGLFTTQAPSASPDPQRPIAKPEVDLNNSSPFAMMQNGYK